MHDLTHLIRLCDDLIDDLLPRCTGEVRADYEAMAYTAANACVAGQLFHVTDAEVRAHLQQFLAQHGPQPGEAYGQALLDWYREQSDDWVRQMHTAADLPDVEREISVDLTIDEVAQQIRDNRWPGTAQGRERLYWLLRQTVTRRRRAWFLSE